MGGADKQLRTFDERDLVASPFACDVHTHTIASRHAYSTIGECVSVAAARGLELLGSCDHFSAMISATVDVRDYQCFINYHIWPEVWNGVRVLHGVEADIVDLEGNLFGFDLMLERGITGRKYKVPHTLKDMVWREIDYAIASIHDETFTREATIVETTEMYVGALEDPKVLILGHIGRAGVPFDLDEVLHLKNHAADRLVVHDLVRLADAAEAERAERLLLVVLTADRAFHLRHAQHLLLCHYSASSAVAAFCLRPQM